MADQVVTRRPELDFADHATLATRARLAKVLAAAYLARSAYMGKENVVADTIEDRLRAAGIELPAPAAAAANYIPVRVSGDLLVVSGQLPMEAGTLKYKGKLGGGVSLEDGQAAARLCAVNILAQVKAACGDLERIVACLRLGGFVACTPEFTDHPKVINGASDLMVAVLGEAGRHARAAVGVPCLPFDAAVEVEGMFELR